MTACNRPHTHVPCPHFCILHRKGSSFRLRMSQFADVPLSLLVNPRFGVRLEPPFDRVKGKSRVYFLDEALTKNSCDASVAIQKQLFYMKSLLSTHSDEVPPLENLSRNPPAANEKTICYFEFFEPKVTNVGLLNCAGPLLVGYPSMMRSMYSGNVLNTGNNQWWDFVTRVFASNITVFDDRYQGPGFWDFLQLVVGQGAGDFSDISVQLQGLAVPSIEREKEEEGTGYDLFEGYNNVKKPNSPDEVSKCHVQHLADVCTVLSGVKALCDKREEAYGTSHLVFYITFAGQRKEHRKSVCIVRLREHDDSSCAAEDYSSAEFLQQLVSELAHAAPKDGRKVDVSLLNDERVEFPLTSSRLTHVLRKVIVRSFDGRRGDSAFHWVLNLPEATVLQEDALSPLCSLEYDEEASTLVRNAVNLFITFQESNFDYVMQGTSNATVARERSPSQLMGRSAPHSPLDDGRRKGFDPTQRKYHFVNMYYCGSTDPTDNLGDPVSTTEKWLAEVDCAPVVSGNSDALGIPCTGDLVPTSQKDGVENSCEAHQFENATPVSLELPHRHTRCRTPSGRIMRVVTHITPKVRIF